MNVLNEQYVWAEDESGERYICVFDDNKEHDHNFEKLSNDEKSHCRPIEFPWN
ncbi:MAG: hypothetical protein QNJ17_05295 [Desulfocapsaceae bacterium]|nr:hypothetical protein [Desulfocapsaceae bacterium]